MTDTELAREATKFLGGKWHGSYGTAPTPGHSNKDRSLSIKPHPTDPDDIVITSFTDGDWRQVKDALRRAGKLPSQTFHSTQKSAAAIAPPTASDASDVHAKRANERLGVALNIWGRTQVADGTPVATYLRWRGIELAKVPVTIRYLAPNPPKYPHPTMVAAFGMADEPEPGLLHISRAKIVGVHLTHLAADGKGKAPVEHPRKMIGLSTGWPLVCAPPNDGLGLLIGEGIETSLWGHYASGLGAWAAGTAGRLPALADKVLDYIECVTIAGEPDEAGQRGAHELAERLAARGIEVLITGADGGA